MLRPTPTTVEPLRVSPPEAVAYQFELEIDPGQRELSVARHDLNADGSAEYFVQSASSLCGNGAVLMRSSTAAVLAISKRCSAT